MLLGHELVVGRGMVRAVLTAGGDGGFAKMDLFRALSVRVEETWRVLFGL